jgi:hypothetical protein
VNGSKRLKDVALFGRYAHSSLRTVKRTIPVSLIALIVWRGLSASVEPTQESADFLVYDEIGRVHIRPPAPSPDSFATDAARIASLPALPNSKSVYAAFEAVHALGMNPITAFAVAPAAVAANAALKANQAQVIEFSKELLNAGTLTHVRLHRDWTRIEMPALRSAAITRPDLGVAYFLDLEKHTYHEIRAAIPAGQNEETYSVSASDDVMITFDKAPVHTPLGVMTLGDLAARGYRTDATFTLSGLIGWCPSGRHIVVEVEYVTDLADPQTSAGPSLEGSKWAREVCMPTNAASHREPGRLVLFRSTAFTGEIASADFVNVLERGNLRTADRNDVSLFRVPANFIKVEQK